MEKKSIKILSLFLLSMFMISFLGGVVTADNGEVAIQKTVSTIAGSFESLFSSWSQGVIGSNVAKIIFFIMVSLLIYLIIGEILPTNKTILIILSFLIGFLATAYITPEEVFSLLNSYTALGLTLITLIPLLILGALTYRAATASSDEGKVQLIMMQWFAWILFAVYSVYRFVYDFFWAKEGSVVMNGILLATAIAAMLVVLFNKRLIKMVAHRYIESSAEAASETFSKAGSALENLKKLEEKAAGTKK